MIEQFVYHGNITHTGSAMSNDSEDEFEIGGAATAPPPPRSNSRESSTLSKNIRGPATALPPGAKVIVYSRAMGGVYIRSLTISLGIPLGVHSKNEMCANLFHILLY